MSNVKGCPNCNKTISAHLGCCWDCWNKETYSNDSEYYCTKCGIDVTSIEKLKSHCDHVQIAETHQLKLPHRLTEKEHKQLENSNYRLEHTKEKDWQKLGKENAEHVLHNLIDEALSQGDKERFLEYTNKLKQLKEDAVHG